ncbi:MAG: prephenate dehydratase [Armatimonadota bacterium]|nr:prephenate dehydratase [Armatimonadota bacterium]
MLIDDLRDRIDEIDAQVLQLLNERARLALEIGRQKAHREESFFAPARERQVIEGMLAQNQGPLPEAAVRAIYREIISSCRALEQRLRVAYWGPPGSFTHVASMQKFGSLVDHKPYESVAEVFAAVSNKQAHYGVVPIENSTEGIVEYTLDTFNESNLIICAEVYVEVSHNLVSLASSVKEVKRLIASAQPLAQCRRWIAQHLQGIEIQEVSTTSRAAKMAAQDPTAAAIANSMAAEIYGLRILQDHIEDSPHNRTRFLVIGHTATPPSGRDKTSLLMSVRHRAGSLFRALAIFDKYDINLTMIESRPSKRTPWEYIFFIDLQGHQRDPMVQKALCRLRQEAEFVKVLGSYPEAE